MEHAYAARYGALETWHWWFRGRQRILEALLRAQLGERRSVSIVSLGCGPSEGLAWLLPFTRPRGRIVGVDVEPQHARLAAGIERIVARMEAVPLPSESVDVVLALDVLEHLEDDSAGLREAGRILKRDGVAIVTVPAFRSLWGGQDVISHHLRRYNKTMLRDTFERAGLPDPRLTYFNTLLFPPTAAVRLARRALGQADRLRSDFDDNRPGLLNEVLERTFAAERHLVNRLSLPIGVSLLGIARRRA